VYPPVNTDFYHPDNTTPGSHLLVVSALVPYKRLELAIEAASMTGARLRIVGDGPDRARLEASAGPTVEFLGRLSDDQVREQYREAAAVILPGEEDFGIVPVEAQACGRPVIALGRGGALETVIDGETGVLVQATTSAAFAAAFDRIASLRFDSGQIRRHAEQFSTGHYLQRMQTAVDETMAAPAGTDW